MKPSDLIARLKTFVEQDCKHSVMIWGAPGIGKSSIVRQIAEAHDFDVRDLRLNQLAPLDIRGIPVADDGVTRWLPPEFLPTDGEGILLLDEMNMATPIMQGLAQQLVLDRRLGSYVVPDGWFVWGAGNRKEDKAVVFDMPAPLANRFLHLQVQCDLDDFKRYAYMRGFDESIGAFLSFRPSLLHNISNDSETWPSPRSWEMANDLLGMDMPIEYALGRECQREFDAFQRLSHELPDIDRILAGDNRQAFPKNPSVAYAAISALCHRQQDAEQLVNAFRWVESSGQIEWAQAFIHDVRSMLQGVSYYDVFLKKASADRKIQALLANYADIMADDP